MCLWIFQQTSICFLKRFPSAMHSGKMYISHLFRNGQLVFHLSRPYTYDARGAVRNSNFFIAKLHVEQFVGQGCVPHRNSNVFRYCKSIAQKAWNHMLKFKNCFRAKWSPALPFFFCPYACMIISLSLVRKTNFLRNKFNTYRLIVERLFKFREMNICIFAT